MQTANVTDEFSENVDIIATRRFTVQNPAWKIQEEITVLICAPEASTGQMYRSRYKIDGLGWRKFKTARGKDSLDALRNALEAIDAELNILATCYGITWDDYGSESTGFTAMPDLQALMGAIACGDDTTALRLAEHLARLGIPQAKWQLGLMLFMSAKGDDRTEALKWMQEAAEQEDASACDFIAGCYISGWLGDVDNTKSAMYRERALDFGFPQ